MARTGFIFALVIIAALAGVLSGADDAWPATPQRVADVHQAQMQDFSPAR